MSLEDDCRRYEALTERLVKGYHLHMVSVCKEADLTPPQFFALRRIREAGRVKMSPLADNLCLSMGAASTLVDRLVVRHLVERQADPTDRRAVFVSLTPRGEAVLTQADAARRAIIQAVLGHVAEPDRARLLSGLEALVTAWEGVVP